MDGLAQLPFSAAGLSGLEACSRVAGASVVKLFVCGREEEGSFFAVYDALHMWGGWVDRRL